MEMGLLSVGHCDEEFSVQLGCVLVVPVVYFLCGLVINVAFFIAVVSEISSLLRVPIYHDFLIIHIYRNSQ